MRTKRFMIMVGFLSISLLITMLDTGLVSAQEPECGYYRIEQTEDEAVIELTEAITEIYPICPELLQALIFYESRNQRTVVSKWGDIGYMQVNPKWQKDRMERLGVTDLTDGYSNLLVGTDYLYELFIKYDDLYIALMAYNQGEKSAVRMYNTGEISDYSRKIVNLSEKLERFHGK